MRYRYGVILDVTKQLRFCGANEVFEKVDRKVLLQHLVNFLTEGVYSARQGNDQLNEMEYLMGKLYDRRIIKSYLLDESVTYMKTCGILFGICESLMRTMISTGMYEMLESTGGEVEVIPVGKNSFAMLIGKT